MRSSSLLEDSQHQPFAGIYDTYMLANSHLDHAGSRSWRGDQARLRLDLLVRRQGATCERSALRLEEEKMAVVIQSSSARRHGSRFYPTFSGVGTDPTSTPSSR